MQSPSLTQRCAHPNTESAETLLFKHDFSGNLHAPCLRCPSYRALRTCHTRWCLEQPPRPRSRFFTDRSSRPGAPRRPPGRQDELHYIVDALVLLHAREHRRAVPAHELRVAVHDLERGVDVLGDVDLTSRGRDDQAPRRANGRAAWGWCERTLLMTSKSDCEIPGPPFLGILSPPCMRNGFTEHKPDTRTPPTLYETRQGDSQLHR